MSPDSVWSLPALHAHLDSKIDELKMATNERFAVAERAVVTALTAQDRATALALNSQKEAALKAEQSAEARHKDLVTRLDAMASITTEKISSMAARVEGMAGSGRGIDKAWGYLVAAVAATGTIIAIVMAFQR